MKELTDQQKKNSLKISKKLRETRKKCVVCGEEFMPYATTQKYCSKKCYGEDIREKRKGKKNPAYRNGMFCGKKKKGSVNTGHRQRDKYVDEVFGGGIRYCEHCGTTETLRFEVHHIVFRSEARNHPELHNHDNFIHLCIECHNKFHKHKWIRNDLVLERGLEDLFQRNLQVRVPEEYINN